MIDTADSRAISATIEGVVDGLKGRVLHGWAWIPVDSESFVIVQVHMDGALIGSAEAVLFRQDLAAAGKRGGHCAFAIALDPVIAAETTLMVTASHGAAQCALTGSPFTVPASADVGKDNSDVLPLPISTTRLQGSLDQCGPVSLHGWVRWLDGTEVSPRLSLHEDGVELLTFEANQWRFDIAEMQQDDGCCGFDLPLPASLRDGCLHTLELHLSDAQSVELKLPFLIHVASTAEYEAQWAARRPTPLRRAPPADKVTLSIIVNFYNMQREAARTLMSLSRAYQRDAIDLDYEVLCIDNGSNPPLDSDWVASFGPAFRLIRPRRQLASPCAALNEAALLARGDYLAVMIDGAHLLTPGVFREAVSAWQQHPDAVVALRHWFIGGDQRWLTMVGYTQAQEDRLFERIRWPANGYALFRIGAPIGEHPEPWFDGLNESNCLMLPTALYDRIGGFDEGFDQPGGGFANLDLWRRASEAASGPLVALIGEASFHQFHGGTTTNVNDDEKDFRVRGYANAYRTLRGEEFARVDPGRLSFRGTLPSEFAIGVRQRTLMPMRLEITEQVRPGQLSVHFDDGAQAHLQSVYAECGLQRDVRWLGQPAGVAPADLVSLQEIIHQIRPDAIVAVGVEAGLIAFLDTILTAVGCAATRIAHVDPPSSETTPPDRLTVLNGSSADASVLATARHWVGSAESVLVLHVAGAPERFSTTSLQAWGALVSYRSYLICIGSLFGQPWLGYSNRQHLQTIRAFTAGDSPFVIDRGWTRQLITSCPSGYLRKVGGGETADTYDTSLDIVTCTDAANTENPR